MALIFGKYKGHTSFKLPFSKKYEANEEQLARVLSMFDCGNIPRMPTVSSKRK